MRFLGKEILFFISRIDDETLQANFQMFIILLT